ncbi:MAG: cold-shock protein [Liquorilactobacillus sp.]|uniref:cold-shock protein n=1 Tax=Liquorilactobacillus sp. TaxID=2767923 RepID=UPI0039ECD54D
MLTGTVHFFEKDEGYGFITPDDDKQDIFVHFSAIKTEGYKTLVEGQRVDFVVAIGKRGPQAVNVHLKVR